MKMVERKCACGAVFLARAADVKRGWGKSCSKSCAATRTNKKTGNFQRFVQARNEAMHQEALGTMESGWDGHKA